MCQRPRLRLWLSSATVITNLTLVNVNVNVNVNNNTTTYVQPTGGGNVPVPPTPTVCTLRRVRSTYDADSHTQYPQFHGTSPGQIDLSGDASYIITGIVWSSWGPNTAIGTGTSNIQGCVPNCASGSETPVTTTITLSDVQGGQFTQFSVTRNGDMANGATSEIMGASS